MAVVQMEGSKALRKGLRQFPGEWKRVVKAANYEVAVIVVRAAPRAAKSPGQKRLAASFKKGTTVGGQTLASARVRDSLPFSKNFKKSDAFGWEFGSHQYKRFGQPWVGHRQPGRVGYKARDDNTAKIRDSYGDAVMNAFAKAYPQRG